jgi:alpha-tubulin suppressor-like RCC1 family protein
MGEVYLGFDVDIPGPPTNKTIQLNVKPRPKKKDKVSGYLVFESSFQAVPGSAADSSSNNAMYKSNKTQASLKSAAIQKSDLVQISATGRREIKVASSLQGGYITYGELPSFEIEMDAATQTKHERKYGYNTTLAAGFDFSLALDHNGNLWCFGENQHGQ